MKCAPIDIGRIMEVQKGLLDDKRTLSGAFAPAVGVCRVCTGKVVAEIKFDHGGLIGGPPPQGHISRWYCADCQLVYRACPPALSSSGISGDGTPSIQRAASATTQGKKP